MIEWFSLHFLFPRVSHRSDAAPSRQRHASEEQQPVGHHRGFRGGRHRGGGGHRGPHLHPPLLGPAEEVRHVSVCRYSRHGFWDADRPSCLRWLFVW